MNATAVRLGLAAATLTAASCASKPARFEVTAAWDDQHADPGCKRRMLRIEVTTAPGATVTAAGVRATAGDDGKATLELRARAVPATGPLVVERDGSVKKEVPVPPLPEARAVELHGDRPDDWAWAGEMAGAVLYSSVADVYGSMDGAELRFTFTGCDLRGGTASGGTVVSKDPDTVEARFPIAAHLGSVKTVGGFPLAFELDVENTDGAHGKLTLTGTLYAASALAAVHAASGGAPVPAAPPWQPGAANAIAVTGPSLGVPDRANALLRGQPLDRAAGILVLGIEHTPSEKMCTGYKDAHGHAGLPKGAKTLRAIIKAKLVARATGAVIAEQTFENEAECPYSLTEIEGKIEPVKASPEWGPILTWLEQQGAATKPG